MVKRATIHVSSRTKKNHPKYGGIRRIKRPTQQAASKQHDTTLDALHLRIKNYTVMNKNNKTNNGNENHGSHCQQMSDGTFDFVVRPPMPQPTLRASKGRSIRSWAASLLPKKPMAPLST